MGPMTETRPRMTSIAVLVTVLTLLAACGVERSNGATPAGDPGVSGTKTEGTTPTTEQVKVEPPVDLPVTGDDGNALNLLATTAVADLEAWWAKELPKAYDTEYIPLTGGLFAYDRSTDPAGLPCGGESIEDSMFNAYFCPREDAVAWDQEELLPYLAENYGEFVVPVVLAHEWGHAVQDYRRGDVRESGVTQELQADCFAGAWVAHVRNDRPTYFDVDTKDLDLALAGILSLKDQPGSLPGDVNAHGSGFDRVGAFQDGYEGAVEKCVTYSDDTVRPYLFDWNGDEDTGGNMPLEDQGDGQGIITASFDSLEQYFSDIFPDIADGKQWNPLEPAVSFTAEDPAECNGKPVAGYRLFLCSPDRYVGYEDAAIRDAYKGGDFAVATLFATQYGLAAQIEMGDDVSGDSVTATLRGDCYAGAWGAALIGTEDYGLSLSPGDLDEGVAVLLSFRTESDRERQGPGFDRIRSFRRGVVEGPAVCTDIKKSLN